MYATTTLQQIHATFMCCIVFFTGDRVYTVELHMGKGSFNVTINQRAKQLG